MVAQSATRARLRVLLLAVVIFVALAVFLWALDKRRNASTSTNPNAEQTRNSVLEIKASPTGSPFPAASSLVNTPSPLASATVTQSPAPTQNSGLAESYAGIVNLSIPVMGIKPDQLIDTFTDARSEGRVHDAIDIPAPAGTPVIAAADGQIIKLFQSDRGGTTIYQASVDRKLIFYYAHLQRYADGLVNEKFVKQGETIAYVGDTGNAGAGNFHLHFSIAIVADPKRYWEGANINPYPLLKK